MLDEIDISFGDFFSILNAMDQGVLIVNNSGYIVFCNHYHCKMDGLEAEEIMGKKVVDVYELDDSSSLLMQALNEKKAFHNVSHIYEARNGRFVNTISNVFPLKKDGYLIGAISFVKEYEYLDGLINTIDGSHKRAVVENTTRFSFKDIIGTAPQFQETIKKAKMASNSPSPVMLYGETGTGKELFAQSIHNYSYRKKKNYMAVNCAAIPETLLEGILFGSTKGAFTGAIEKPGLFEQANGGTLFLDEINSMPIGLQGKLLRVLQEKKVRRIGAEDEIHLDIKIISSTNTAPAKAMEIGELRKDLFYRLGVVFLSIPSLRERPEDIDALVDHFIQKYNTLLHKTVHTLSENVKYHFRLYHWPGNVRELENAIEGAMNMVGTHEILQFSHLTSDFTIEKSHLKTQAVPDLSPHPPSHNATSLDEFNESAAPSSDNQSCLNEISSADGNGLKDPISHFVDSPNHPEKSLDIQKSHLPNEESKHNKKRILKMASSAADDAISKDKKNIEEALRLCNGNVSQTAIMLNISRQSLHKKINRLQIDRKQILAGMEIKKIEESLRKENGNITHAAKNIGISRQLLNYKIKKYRIASK